MDPLSAGASALAFVGLAGKLGSGFIKVYQFWSSIQDAPEEARAIAREIRLLSHLLDEIGPEEENYLLHPTTDMALQDCSTLLQKLNAIIIELNSGFDATKWGTRKWSSVKTVLRRERIKSIQTSLSDAKSSLTLCLQSSLSRKSRLQHESLTQQVAALHVDKDSWDFTISSDSMATEDRRAILAETNRFLSSIRNPVLRAGVSQLVNEALKNHPSAEKSNRLTETSLPRDTVGKQFCSVITNLLPSYCWNSILGMVRVERTTRVTKREEVCLVERGAQTQFVIRPSSWLVTLGLRYEAAISLIYSRDSFTLSKDVVRIVPSDSPIFEYCRDGKIEKVQNLLSHDPGAIKNVDNYGRTPLHMAATSYQVEVCRLLIQQGAYPRLDDANFCPLTVAIHGERYNSQVADQDSQILERQIATQRLLLRSHPEEYTLTMLIFLIKNYLKVRAWPNDSSAVSFWTLLQSSAVMQSDLEYLTDNNEDLDVVQRLWKKSVEWEKRGYPSSAEDEYDAVLDRYAIKQGQPSVAHSFVRAHKSPTEIASLVLKDAEIHAVARTVEPFYSITYPPNAREIINNLIDTPTSLAMYTSDAFHAWRQGLIEAGVDLKQFVAQELRQTHQLDALKGDSTGSTNYWSQMEMPLLETGWSNLSLLSLFTCDFEPSTCKKSCRCSPYARGPLLKQPQWLRMLGMVKAKVNSESMAPRGARTHSSPLVIQLPTTFCMPNHDGCYMCNVCWEKSGCIQGFWSARDAEFEDSDDEEEEWFDAETGSR